MSAAPQPLTDDAARRTAIAVHDRSFLVEAGAGSGKTALMAGRIALMLAEGVAPKSIAAVTFTEFAASELLIRVRELADALAAGCVPTALRIALPHGLSQAQQRCLAAAHADIDELTCSTIHGFCQRLIKPYPVEADIDPGAMVMDRDQADLVFEEIVEEWLREALGGGGGGGLLEELVLQDPDQTIALIHGILARLRSYREATGDAAPQDLAALAGAFRSAVQDLNDFVRKTPAEEAETALIAQRLTELAEGLVSDFTGEDPAERVALLRARPHPDLCTVSGSFRAYKKKGKWAAAAKRVGLSKADGDQLNETANAHYAVCRMTWTQLCQCTATRVLSELVALVQPVTARFRDHKRSAAQLDFDDLLFAARDLLRDHEPVRRALAARFAHVLVDEFQDTDPLQAEIFWRLCGEPARDMPAPEWLSFQIRPGALFLVGDPKQAIYRFRGAEVGAYLRAREAFRAQDPASVLSISTNFRSCPSILHFVNARFEEPLSLENGQPGFTALDPFQAERAAGPSVAALDIEVADENGKATADAQRDGEAEAVADLCARLIGSETIVDHEADERRACRPGDIALLAPTGSDLWRYEEALERRGIPVATQAGKGLYRRQEIQDLIAVTRVLAERRDTLALGALLRGPLVGLTEEALLDIVEALPRPENAPDSLPRLHLGVDPQIIAHPLARDIIEKLSALQRSINATTPHALLSQAVDVLRVRPILLARHGGQAERALANVDLYLSFSRAYAVRGLRAFAEAMTGAWTDESRAIEGRPDAQEESVALYTMHAAKGLEWPIVVPVNTMTRLRAPDQAVFDRATGRLYFPVLGVEPAGHTAALETEKAELDRERVRLWYVAATRARELLVLPRLDVPASKSAWSTLVDLALAGLPALDLGAYPARMAMGAPGAVNDQTRELFAQQAAAIARHPRCMVWLAPSRDEGTTEPALEAPSPRILSDDADGAPTEPGATIAIQGGRERGLILHKLLEEVLNAETPEAPADLATRAEALIRTLGRPVADDPAEGLAPRELAGCVARALALPEIAACRPRLIPEVPVYSATSTSSEEQVTVGIADAIAFGAKGTPQVVIDWKSDVDPSPETLRHYCDQVRAYLDVTGAERGLIVALTSGTVTPVLPTSSAIA